MRATSARHPQYEVDDDGRQQSNRQHRRTEAVIEATLAALPDTLGAPVEGDEGVQHGRHGDKREETGANLADLVTKVEEADGEAAQDDGEVEP